MKIPTCQNLRPFQNVKYSVTLRARNITNSIILATPFVSVAEVLCLNFHRCAKRKPVSHHEILYVRENSVCRKFLFFLYSLVHIYVLEVLLHFNFNSEYRAHACLIHLTIHAWSQVQGVFVPTIGSFEHHLPRLSFHSLWVVPRLYFTPKAQSQTSEKIITGTSVVVPHGQL